jgi:hypothetical protein
MKYLINRKTKEHYVYGEDSPMPIPFRDWALVQADSEGWIPFSGDKCPLPDDVRCDLKFDTGRISSGAFLASKWEWNSPYIAYYRPFLTEQAEPVQEPERKCSECGNNENDLSLYCVRCLNNDGWYLTDDAQAQAQAVNQQLLDDIVNLLIAAKGAIKLGSDVNATNYISAAIAAAQEQKL